MDKFEKKYGIKENKKVKDFHKSRRMFCIKDNKLYIADLNMSDSHAVWFEKEGWIKTDEDDNFMNNTVRGFVDSDGDIYFYVGYDFRISRQAEKIFFAHLKELVRKLKIKPGGRIGGGLVKQAPGTKWPPQKFYGLIKEFLI